MIKNNKFISLFKHTTILGLLFAVYSSAFAYTEKVHLKQVVKDDLVIVKTQQHEVYKLSLGLGCNHIKDYLHRKIIIESSGSDHPPFGLTNASSKVMLQRFNESCIIWGSEKIAEKKTWHLKNF